MKQRAVGCLIIIILCAMCMTGTSLPTLGFGGGDGGGDTSFFEDMDLSFDQVPVNEDYAQNFKRDASGDAEPEIVQPLASGSGCTWTESEGQFVIPENESCIFALNSSPDSVTVVQLQLIQGDTISVKLEQPDEMTQGGKSDKPVFRLSYDATPTPIPTVTPISAATADPNATATPQPTSTPPVVVPVIPTATPSAYQLFQDKAGLLTISDCTFYADPEVDENGNALVESRSCVVEWVQGSNTDDVWWKSWVSGDFAWNGLFTRE